MKNNHISICICTYKRPIFLDRLLVTLQNLKTEDQFKYSVVVVDNDSNKSGEDIVSKFLNNPNYKIHISNYIK